MVFASSSFVDGRFVPNGLITVLVAITGFVCLGLVNFGNGFRAPIEEVGRLCRDRGVLLVVDATQALGALEVDVRRLGCHVFMRARKVGDPVSPTPPPGIWPGPFSNGA